VGALFLGYGLVCYLAFLAAFGYLMAFVGDLGVPRSVSAGPAGPPGLALAADLGLLALFGLQHSLMARPAFKRAWTRIVPPALERSTYVLLSSLALAVLFRCWRPIPGTVWAFRPTALYARVRHPLMLGFLVAFWAAPRMTLGHLVFAAGASFYILVGTILEERDLLRELGPGYAAYRRQVPRFFPAP